LVCRTKFDYNRSGSLNGKYGKRAIQRLVLFCLKTHLYAFSVLVGVDRPSCPGQMYRLNCITERDMKSTHYSQFFFGFSKDCSGLVLVSVSLNKRDR